MTDEETTNLQFAVDAGDAAEVCRLLAPHSGDVLSGVQFYGNSTAFMYALERSTPEVVRAFLDKGVTPFELPWSDNNELKSAINNREHGPVMVQLVLEMLPDGLALDMITTDWNPDDQPQGDIRSAFQLAEKLQDPTCKELLLKALDRLKNP
jgi:hypothetical protein